MLPHQLTSLHPQISFQVDEELVSHLLQFLLLHQLLVPLLMSMMEPRRDHEQPSGNVLTRIAARHRMMLLLQMMPIHCMMSSLSTVVVSLLNKHRINLDSIRLPLIMIPLLHVESR
jgi:hypothetical protein